MFYRIPAQLVQNLVNYLVEQPWKEVNPLLSSLVTLIQQQDKENAQQNPLAGSPNGGFRPQPPIREEGRGADGSSQGVQ